MVGNIVPLADIGSLRTRTVGGKSANLASLLAAGFPVPDGVVITADAYDSFLRSNRLNQRIEIVLQGVSSMDETVVENASRTIKEMITSCKLEPGFEELIDKALADFDDSALWAIRSSSAAEDLPDASFAGQQDTYLSVRRTDVGDHVKRCWASYWNARAIIYRHNAGVGHLGHGIAVIVQRMVDARSSGIMFTSDPVRSHRNRIVIESSWGLGESIVSGTVSPDRFSCNKRTHEITERSISRKTSGVFLSDLGKSTIEIDAAKQSIPSITDPEIHAIAEMGEQIEKLFRAPQDIEWAVEGNSIYILQSRPITTLLAEEEILWTRAYGDEYWSEVTSPLFYSLLGEYLTEYVNHEGSRILGYKGIMDAELLRVHKSHVYFNAAVLEEVFTYNPRFSRTRELLNYFPEPDQERIATAKTKIVPRLWSEVRVALLDPDGMIIRTDKAYKEWASKFLGEMKVFDETDLTKLRDDELYSEFRRMEAAYLKHYRLIRYGMVTHSIGTNLIVKRWLFDWLDDKSGVLYSKLITGLPDNKTIETNIAISKLAKLAREDETVRRAFEDLNSDELIAKMKSDPSLAAFEKMFNQFMKDYGHRSHTREIFYSRWIDDPTLVVDAARALIPSQLDLEELIVKKRQERLKTEREVFARISEMKYGFIRKMIFKTVLGFAQTYLVFRENQRFYLDHQILRQRKLFMEYGRRYVQRGILSDPTDIFFLSKEEVFDLPRRPIPGISAEIGRRRKEFAANKDVLPPKFLRGKVEFDDAMVQDGEMKRIAGTSASPGIVTGVVRVVASIRYLSEVEQGEILVTSNTDPGWTSVFSKIGGLVTETGGILSHGAVVSREYGIPAITAVKNATAILKTGQRVRLDGNEGVIYLLEVSS